MAPSLADGAELFQLDNGLRVCVLENHRSPIITTALCYRAGTRDETPGQAGIAHFLEHMMFKGSARYGPGEVDSRTQALGGSNNAFTSHDTTLYHFSFAGQNWNEALAVEADRMRGLTLDPRHFEAERRVILEELSMVLDDPWEALEREAAEAFYGAHPYGRMILGRREDLETLTTIDLAAFHREFYSPRNAVLVVAGDTPDGARERIAEALAEVHPGVGRPADRSAAQVPAMTRVERRRGDLARLLLLLPAVPAEHDDYPALSLLVAVLGGGRSSRLQTALVEERPLALSASVDVNEALDEGVLAIAVEVLPSTDAHEVEEIVFRELHRLVENELADEELNRAKRMLAADWVFAHEKIAQQAMTLALAHCLFEVSLPERTLRDALVCDSSAVRRMAARLLPDSPKGVVSWSMPANGR